MHMGAKGPGDHPRLSGNLKISILGKKGDWAGHVATDTL